MSPLTLFCIVYILDKELRGMSLFLAMQVQLSYELLSSIFCYGQLSLWIMHVALFGAVVPSLTV